MRPTMPAWYASLREFNYVFYSAADLLFVFFGILIVLAVARPGWRHHFRWAVPAAVSSIVIGLDRMLLDIHHYLQIGTALDNYLTTSLLRYAASILSLYSIVALWQTLWDSIRNPSSPDSRPQPGVWPPPPTVRP